MRTSPVVRRLRAATVVGAVTLILLEFALRLGADILPLPSPFEQRPRATDESLFWRYSPDTGWDLAPHATGHFTNGFFDGEVSTDNRGIRKNSKEGTYIAGYRNILFIGDSTTASFEVDDDETAPARLEQLLRSRGEHVNVLNLGVRGYGTDQSVLKALRYAADLQPTDIIYLYTDNDIYNNNTLKQKGRKYGKGVYIRDSATRQFAPLQYPVPERPADYAGLITMNSSCDPAVHEESGTADGVITPAAPAGNAAEQPDNEGLYSGIKLAAREYSYVARAVFPEVQTPRLANRTGLRVHRSLRIVFCPASQVARDSL